MNIVGLTMMTFLLIVHNIITGLIFKNIVNAITLDEHSEHSEHIDAALRRWLCR